MKAGIYARVSTQDQTLEQQIKPLEEHCIKKGWEYVVYQEKTSGAKESRTELDKLMGALRKGELNAVIVYKLDRLGRSLKHLIQLVEEFNNLNVVFVCLSPEIDTKTAQGRFFLQVIGAVAELERELIRERTKSKLDYLRSTGKILGRPSGSKDKNPRRKSGYWLRYANK